MKNQSLKTQIDGLFEAIKNLEENQALQQESKLPANCYFLNSDTILSQQRGDGDARYPYSYNGMTLWAYTSGNMKMEESVFNVLLPSYEGKEPNIACFAGASCEDGFFPISLLGTARQLFEKQVKRHTVFTPKAVFYLTQTPEFKTGVRLFVDAEKRLRISVCLENCTGKKLSTYVSLYADFLMTQWAFEQDDAKYFKYGKVTKNGYLFHTSEGALDHYGVVVRSETKENVQSTTSRYVYTGSVNNQLNCAQSLLKGGYTEEKEYTEFTETAILADMIAIELDGHESFSVSYTCAFNNNEEMAKTLASQYVSTEEIDQILLDLVEADMNRDEKEKKPTFAFNGVCSDIGSDKVFNGFIENVLRQVEFCARAKNYVGPFVGVRDIFQQLEASLFWIPDYSRSKIIEALGYLGDDGRAPRQYSYPLFEGALPRMDLRPFIDQGVWIISTVYTYLTFTGDYSILDEKCGYYHFDGYNVSFSERYDTVLDHLLCITDYLIGNIAPDTGCLRVLFGDWNDALDGLGRPDDKTKEYGNGVSVMATLQFYKNLNEMIAILQKTGNTGRIAELEKYKSIIKEGLQRHAIVSNEKGERKIVHGWGDNIRFKIGSFCDNDCISRDGVTSNAFWILAGAIEWDKTLVKDILAAYDRLDSKYGLKTFEPYFALDNQDVGRIIRLPKGTAENAATYIHATLFGIMSLFAVGESKRAWEQLYKVLPFTHEIISTSPFVMPNSYVYDEERGYDGQSMSDWFTGSGCVLVKILTWFVFGIMPDLDGVTICPANDLPMEKATACMRVKGANITIECKNIKKRTYIVNGMKKASVYDEDLKADKIYLTNAELHGDIRIIIE